MGHTFRMVGAAFNTSAVSGNQPVDLGWSGEANISALPQELALCREDLADPVRVLHQLFNKALWQWLAVHGGEGRGVGAVELIDGGRIELRSNSPFLASLQKARCLEPLRARNSVSERSERQLRLSLIHI